MSISVRAKEWKQLTVSQPSGQRIEVVEQSKRVVEFVCDMEERMTCNGR